MTDITELAQLKPGKYAILYRDNWDGEKNEYHTLAALTEEGGWYDDEFNAELLKYQGDKILKVWPLDDGSNVLALVEALEKAQQQIDELENDEVHQRLANAEHQLRMAELAKHNLKVSRKAQFRKRKAAEKRVAELESKLANPVQLPKTNGYWTDTEKAFEEAITLAKRQVRLAGFIVEDM